MLSVQARVTDDSGLLVLKTLLKFCFVLGTKCLRPFLTEHRHYIDFFQFFDFNIYRYS
jgi:hypothetical protein